jgi:hypothetical protein
VRLDELGKLEKKINYLIVTRTGDFPTLAIVPEPTTLPRVPGIVLFDLCKHVPLVFLFGYEINKASIFFSIFQY